MKKVIYILMTGSVCMFIFGIYETFIGQFEHGISLVVVMLVSFLLGVDWVKTDNKIKRLTDQS